MYSDEIVLLHAYLSTPERKEICHNFIKQFKNFGYDVILASHLPLDTDTQKLVDYAIYDKDNILITEPEYKGYITHYTPHFNISSREFFKHSSILAVKRLLLAGASYAKMLNKKIIHLFDYDGYLPDNEELNKNSDLIREGHHAVLYERERQEFNIPHKDGKGITHRHWQIMTLIMSSDVNFLYDRMMLFDDDHLKYISLEHSMQIGEELLGYIFGISFLNETHEHDITNDKFALMDTSVPIDKLVLKNLEMASEVIGFEKQKIFTDSDFPWICLSYIPENKMYKFFALSPKGEISVILYLNDNLYSTFDLSDWAWRTHDIEEHNFNKLTIHVNNNFFREYDLTKPETKEYIIQCNWWHDI